MDVASSNLSVPYTPASLRSHTCRLSTMQNHSIILYNLNFNVSKMSYKGQILSISYVVGQHLCTAQGLLCKHWYDIPYLPLNMYMASISASVNPFNTTYIPPSGLCRFAVNASAFAVLWNWILIVLLYATMGPARPQALYLLLLT